MHPAGSAPGRPGWLTPADPGFAAALRGPGPNELRPSRHPAAIVAPRSIPAVQAAVRGAGDAGRRVAVRSGGHSWVASSVRDDSVLLDLAALDQVIIDHTARTARIGPGATTRTVTRELARAGLAFPVGHCGGPGVGGYLLGGGIGLNWIQWGPACDWVQGVHAVTADGEHVHSDADERPDLLWLARGSGPFFPAVATAFDVALTALPTDTRVSRWTFDLDRIEDVTRWVAACAPQVGDNVEITVAIDGPGRALLPPSSGVPNHVLRVTATAFAHDDQAPAALGALREPPPVTPLAQEIDVPVPFEELHLAVDAGFPAGHRYLVDTFWIDGDVHTALASVAELAEQAPAAKTRIHTIVTDNRRRPNASPDRGAFTRDSRTLVVAYLAWPDAADDATNRTWLGQLSDQLAPVTCGHFISEADLTRTSGRAEGSFRPGAWERLRALRRTWDPGGRLHGEPGPTDLR